MAGDQTVEIVRVRRRGEGQAAAAGEAPAESALIPRRCALPPRGSGTSRARSVTSSALPSAEAWVSTRSAPTPSADAPALMKSAAVFTVDAAGGDQLHLRQRRLERLDVARRRPARRGEDLHDVGSRVPGREHLRRRERSRHAPARRAARQVAIVARLSAGLTTKRAPASMHARARLGIEHGAGADEDVRRRGAPPRAISSIAPGTVIVISSTETPPFADRVDRRQRPRRPTARGSPGRRRSPDAVEDGLLVHLSSPLPPRAPRPSSRAPPRRGVAIVVSPGVVMASAPWAAPHSTAHCGPLPARKP